MSPDVPPPPPPPTHTHTENVWDMIERRVRQRQRPPSMLSELGQALQEEWNRLPRMVIGRIIRSIPRRLNERVTNRGGITHYR